MTFRIVLFRAGNTRREMLQVHGPSSSIYTSRCCVTSAFPRKLSLVPGRQLFLVPLVVPVTNGAGAHSCHVKHVSRFPLWSSFYFHCSCSSLPVVCRASPVPFTPRVSWSRTTRPSFLPSPRRITSWNYIWSPFCRPPRGFVPGWLGTAFGLSQILYRSPPPFLT